MDFTGKEHVVVHEHGKIKGIGIKKQWQSMDSVFLLLFCFISVLKKSVFS